ncbi:MAG TPA: acyltransferase [Baekduia sp.]|uniref:acyltransferase family protein n=1 Tax=Baekduia sp. TaxID=2600305 RepID=UPI002D767F06|nr:acyltransferase [Baekduia sp.]HET6506173.1 acyltransferase [Baekduia sp.]
MHGHETPGTAIPEEAPEALRPPPGNPRFPLVDGLRAVAALMVLIGHTSFISGFNGHGQLGRVISRFDMGVALFFIISGFLLYRPFVSARLDGRPAPGVLRYGRRRLLRIVPAYWLALTVLAIWPGLRGDVFGHVPVYYGFLQNLKVAWIGGGINTVWSLACEMQFYILLPFLAIGGARLLEGRPVKVQVRAELVALAVLGAASFAVRMWSYHRSSVYPNTVSWTVAGTFLWFAFGMALAVVSARYHRADVRPAPLRALDRRPWISWIVAAGLIAIVTHIGLPTTAPQVYTASDWFWEHLLYGLIAVAIAVPATVAIVSPRSLPHRILAFGPVAWLGLISYGIFLWHHPLTEKFIKVQDWTSHGSFVIYTLVVFGVAAVAATLSYYLVERPILKFKDPRPRRRAPAPASAGTVSAAQADGIEPARAL